MVVVMSAVLTSVLLSYIFIPRSLESPVSEEANLENEQLAVVVQAGTEASIEPAVNRRDLGLDSDRVDPLDAAGVVQSLDAAVMDLGSPQDMRVKKTTKSVPPKKRQTPRKTSAPNRKKKQRSKSNPALAARTSKMQIVTPSKSSTRPDATVQTKIRKNTVDAGVSTTSDPVDSSVQAKVIKPQGPSLKMLTGGIVMSTKAAKTGNGGYQISSTGDLFQTTISGIKISLRLSAPRGRFLLSAQARPWANITVDGRKLGGTPLAAFPLASGTHTIEFTTTQDTKAAFRLELSR